MRPAGPSACGSSSPTGIARSPPASAARRAFPISLQARFRRAAVPAPPPRSQSPSPTTAPTNGRQKLATQLLIYETSTPVAHARHGDWSVEVGTDYSFSRGVNSVPLMSVEILGGGAEYAVAFGGAGAGVGPAGRA